MKKKDVFQFLLKENGKGEMSGSKKYLFEMLL